MPKIENTVAEKFTIKKHFVYMGTLLLVVAMTRCPASCKTALLPKT